MLLEHGLKEDYANDYVFAHTCRLFRVLAFVPVDKVKEYYDAIITSNRYDERLNAYCDYFMVGFY